MLVKENGAVELKLLTPGSNWMKIGGVIAADFVGYYSSLPEGSRVQVHTGHPARTALLSPQLVDDGEFDIGMATPSWILRTCNEGIGARGIGEKPTKLSLLAALPHHDFVAFAVRKSLGITSIRQLIDQKYPLRVSTTPLHNDHPLGWALDLMFQEYGIEIEDFEKWGGKVIYDDRQQNVMEKVPEGNMDRLTGLKTGVIDAVFDEAIMTKNWRDVSEAVEFNYLPVDEDVLEALERRYGFASTVMPKGYLRGVERDVPTMEFGGWTMFCREDLSEDMAYLTLESLERQKLSIESMFSPSTGLSEKIDFSKTCRVDGVPLHPGAERFYRDRGIDV